MLPFIHQPHKKALEATRSFHPPSRKPLIAPKYPSYAMFEVFIIRLRALQITPLPDNHPALIPNTMLKNKPKIGVRYPVRLGQSMLHPSSPGDRQYIAMCFRNLPESISTTEPGIIRREGDTLQLHLPVNSAQGMKFSGFRMNPSSPNAVRHFLVFHDDVLYLERISSVYDDIRPVDGSITDAPNVPPRQEGLVKSIPWAPPSLPISPVSQGEQEGLSEAASNAYALTRFEAPKIEENGAHKAKESPNASTVRKLGVVGGIQKPSSSGGPGKKSGKSSLATMAIQWHSTDRSDGESSDFISGSGGSSNNNRSEHSSTSSAEKQESSENDSHNSN